MLIVSSVHSRCARWSGTHLFRVVAIICLTTFHWLHADSKILADALSGATNFNTSITLSLIDLHKIWSIHLADGNSLGTNADSDGDDDDNNETERDEDENKVVADFNAALKRRKTQRPRPMAKTIILKLKRGRRETRLINIIEQIQSLLKDDSCKKRSRISCTDSRSAGQLESSASTRHDSDTSTPASALPAFEHPNVFRFNKEKFL